MALNGLSCADVPLTNYSLTHSRKFVCLCVTFCATLSAIFLLFCALCIVKTLCYFLALNVTGYSLFVLIAHCNLLVLML